MSRSSVGMGTFGEVVAKSRRTQYDAEVERLIEALPGYAPEQVYGAVQTIRQDRRFFDRDPADYQRLYREAGKPLPIRSLDSAAVAEKVRQLYRRQAVVPCG